MSEHVDTLRLLVTNWRAVAHELRYSPAAMPFSACRVEDCADELEAAIQALTPAPAGEVVAWGYLHTLPDGRWKVTKGSQHGGGFDTWAADMLPLYTTPQPAPTEPAPGKGLLPQIQRWFMAYGSDAARWSVYMDKGATGEWCKFAEVEQKWLLWQLAYAQQHRDRVVDDRLLKAVQNILPFLVRPKRTTSAKWMTEGDAVRNAANEELEAALTAALGAKP